MKRRIEDNQNQDEDKENKEKKAKISDEKEAKEEAKTSTYDESDINEIAYRMMSDDSPTLTDRGYIRTALLLNPLVDNLSESFSLSDAAMSFLENKNADLNSKSELANILIESFRQITNADPQAVYYHGDDVSYILIQIQEFLGLEFLLPAQKNEAHEIFISTIERVAAQNPAALLEGLIEAEENNRHSLVYFIHNRLLENHPQITDRLRAAFTNCAVFLFRSAGANIPTYLDEDGVEKNLVNIALQHLPYTALQHLLQDLPFSTSFIAIADQATQHSNASEKLDIKRLKRAAINELMDGIKEDAKEERLVTLHNSLDFVAERKEDYKEIETEIFDLLISKKLSTQDQREHGSWIYKLAVNNMNYAMNMANIVAQRNNFIALAAANGTIARPDVQEEINRMNNAVRHIQVSAPSIQNTFITSYLAAEIVKFCAENNQNGLQIFLDQIGIQFIDPDGNPTVNIQLNNTVFGYLAFQIADQNSKPHLFTQVVKSIIESNLLENSVANTLTNFDNLFGGALEAAGGINTLTRGDKSKIGESFANLLLDQLFEDGSKDAKLFLKISSFIDGANFFNEQEKGRIVEVFSRNFIARYQGEEKNEEPQEKDRLSGLKFMKGQIKFSDIDGKEKRGILANIQNATDAISSGRFSDPEKSFAVINKAGTISTTNKSNKTLTIPAGVGNIISQFAGPISQAPDPQIQSSQPVTNLSETKQKEEKTQ